MTTTLRDLVATSFKYGKSGKGVLTTEQAYSRSILNNRSMVTISSYEDNVFFFSDDHIFGYKVLSDNFVPCSGGFPTNVSPRESVPDGKVDTIEKFIAIFHEGQRQITTIEELAEFIDSKNQDLNNTSMKIFDHEEHVYDAPMPVYENDDPMPSMSNPDGSSTGVSLGQLLYDKERTIDALPIGCKLTGPYEGMGVVCKITDETNLETSKEGNEMKPKEIKWQPQHFPVGTVAVLGGYKQVGEEYIFSENGNAEVTVTGCIQNGPDSYVIMTDIWCKHLEIFKGFNLDHVTGIKTRGTGPVIVKGYRGDIKPMINLKSEVSFRPLNKNRYFTRSVRELINYLVKTSILPKGLFIKEGFHDFFLSQSFVNKTSEGWNQVFDFDKKKAKRFIRQNINRWIEPMKEIRIKVTAAEKRDYEEYLKDMEDEWDRDFDNRHPEIKDEPTPILVKRFLSVEGLNPFAIYEDGARTAMYSTSLKKES